MEHIISAKLAQSRKGEVVDLEFWKNLRKDKTEEALEGSFCEHLSDCLTDDSDMEELSGMGKVGNEENGLNGLKQFVLAKDGVYIFLSSMDVEYMDGGGCRLKTGFDVVNTRGDRICLQGRGIRLYNAAGIPFYETHDFLNRCHGSNAVYSKSISHEVKLEWEIGDMFSLSELSAIALYLSVFVYIYDYENRYHSTDNIVDGTEEFLVNLTGAPLHSFDVVIDSDITTASAYQEIERQRKEEMEKRLSSENERLRLKERIDLLETAISRYRAEERFISNTRFLFEKETSEDLRSVLNLSNISQIRRMSEEALSNLSILGTEKIAGEIEQCIKGIDHMAHKVNDFLQKDEIRVGKKEMLCLLANGMCKDDLYDHPDLTEDLLGNGYFLDDYYKAGRDEMKDAAIEYLKDNYRYSWMPKFISYLLEHCFSWIKFSGTVSNFKKICNGCGDKKCKDCDKYIPGQNNCLEGYDNFFRVFSNKISLYERTMVLDFGNSRETFEKYIECDDENKKLLALWALSCEDRCIRDRERTLQDVFSSLCQVGTNEEAKG